MLKAKIDVLRCIVVLLAPAVLHAGEARFVALHPLYTPQTAVLNPALVDMWGDDFFSVRIESDGEAGYRVKDPADGQDFAGFHLVQIGGETIADVVFGEVQLLQLQLPVHYFARVRVEGNTLHTDWLGSEELAQQVERTGWPRHERLPGEGREDDFLVLTDSSAELQRFVLDCLKRPEAFGESDDFERTVRQSTTALKPAAETVRVVRGEPDYRSIPAAVQYRAGAFNKAQDPIAPRVK